MGVAQRAGFPYLLQLLVGDGEEVLVALQPHPAGDVVEPGAIGHCAGDSGMVTPEPAPPGPSTLVCRGQQGPGSWDTRVPSCHWEESGGWRSAVFADPWLCCSCLGRGALSCAGPWAKGWSELAGDAQTRSTCDLLGTQVSGSRVAPAGLGCCSPFPLRKSSKKESSEPGSLKRRSSLEKW